MKERIISLLTSALLLLSLCACGKSGSSLPPLNALASLPQSAVEEIVTNHDRDTLLAGWGTPERSMEGNLGDTWLLDDGRELQVIYNEYGKVFVVRINE